MPPLNRRTLPELDARAARSPARGAATVRVLQIGDGNFLRGFADWMIDLANGQGLMNAEVTVVSPRSAGVIARLAAQDGLFTVVTRGLQGGVAVDERRLVTCVTEAINPRENWAAVVACAVGPRTRFCISNTTEAGIADVEEPLSAEAPQSFPAKVAALLWARFQRLGGSAASGQVFIPCELVEDNGAKLEHIVLQHAQRWALPEAFARWVRDDNTFVNTLVDRIVPGFPAADAAKLWGELGYQDDMMIAAEPFHLFVIEAPNGRARELAAELPLKEAGLQVIWTQDIKPFRSSKVRVLNGAHTASALAAFSAGLDTVLAMTEDATMSRYLDRLVFDEIVPFVPLPPAEAKRYAQTILERFRNPHIRHELISIALNSVSKWQIRVLPTVVDYAREHGAAPPLLSFSLAALLDFYRGQLDANGDYVGRRHGAAYPIRDTGEAIAALCEGWSRWSPGTELEPHVRGMLADTRLWRRDLNDIPRLRANVTAALDAIHRKGVKAALDALLQERIAVG